MTEHLRLEAVEDRSLEDPYNLARKSGSAFLACEHSHAPTLFDRVFDALFIAGHKNPAEAVGLCMHHYLLCSLACYPLPALHYMRYVRRKLLQRIRSQRLLIANTGGIQTHEANNRMELKRTASGYLLSGVGAFMSLSHVADFALVPAILTDEGRDALCLVPLTDNAQITKRPLFSGVMAKSGTARVEFDRYQLTSGDVYLARIGQPFAQVGMYQRIWFQGLVVAPYLGLAASLLNAVGEQLRTIRSANGELLANLDGVNVELGKLQIRLRTAVALARAVGAGLARINNASSPSLGQLHEEAMVVKYVGTRAAEEIIASAVLLPGARGLSLPAARLGRECVHFGRAHPASEFDVERYFGALSLSNSRMEILKWT